MNNDDQDDASKIIFTSEAVMKYASVEIMESVAANCYIERNKRKTDTENADEFSARKQKK